MEKTSSLSPTETAVLDLVSNAYVNNVNGFYDKWKAAHPIVQETQPPCKATPAPVAKDNLKIKDPSVAEIVVPQQKKQEYLPPAEIEESSSEEASPAAEGPMKIVVDDDDEELIGLSGGVAELKREKLLLEHKLSPGDVLVMTAAVRDLHKSFGSEYMIDVDTSCSELWENNPYLTKFNHKDPDVRLIHMEYPLIHHSNEGASHFINGFIDFLSDTLNKKIKPTALRGDIHISNEEKGWLSQVHEVLSKDVPYWVVDAGGKTDYTAKIWAADRFQAVVDAFPKLWFVQIGAKEHIHPPLKGNNVINLVGKTDTRQLIRVIYHSVGVIAPVSFPMHLAAAIEMKQDFMRMTRPCIVLAGGREPTIWEAYTNHAFLHTCGMLDCCQNGGCWKSRIVPLGDGDDKDNNLCKHPVLLSTKQTIPKCLDMISAKDVIRKIKEYMNFYSFLPEERKKEFFTKFPDIAW